MAQITKEPDWIKPGVLAKFRPRLHHSFDVDDGIHTWESLDLFELRAGAIMWKTSVHGDTFPPARMTYIDQVIEELDFLKSSKL